MKNINPNPFTTRPEIDGTFGVVTSTHWIATAVGMGDAGEGRQRLRRRASRPPSRCRWSSRTSTGRAATCRSSSTTCARGKHRGDLRPGPGAGRGDHRALPRASASTWCPAPACSRPACRARSTPGCCCCATTARCGSRDVLAPAIGYAARRLSAGRARQRHHRDRRGAVPRALADIGGGLSAGRQGAGDRHAVHQQDAGRDLRAHPAARRRAPAATACAQIERGAQGLVAGLRRRGDRHDSAARRR